MADLDEWDQEFNENIEFVPDIVENSDDDSEIRDNCSDGAASNEVDINEKSLKRKMKLARLKEIVKKNKMEKVLVVNQIPVILPMSSELVMFIQKTPEISNLFESDDFIFCFKTSEEKTSDCLFTKAILQVLPKFKKMIKTSTSTNDVRGCPLVIILTMSAIRATDILKSISKQFHCKIAKLFAKHIKIQEQIEYLNMYNFPIAIGTPHRLNKLLEVGSLQLSKTKFILLDDTYKDQKNFSLATLPSINKDLVHLFKDNIYPEMNHIKLVCI